VSPFPTAFGRLTLLVLIRHPWSEAGLYPAVQGELGFCVVEDPSMSILEEAADTLSLGAVSLEEVADSLCTGALLARIPAR
jgi:hypothetical protein